MEKLNINGASAQATYNMYLADENYAQIFKIKAKDKYSYDWKDGNGVETDPEEPTYYESQTLSVSLLFVCNSYADFNTKLDALMNVLKSPNGALWNFVELGKTLRLQFVEITDFTDIDLPNGKTKITISLKNNWQ